MRCPLCDLQAPRSEVHAHLVAEHPEGVRTWEDGDGRMRYEVACPICDATHVHRVKPRSTDPGFLAEFAAEIRLVAYDMLLNHVQAEHLDAPADAPAAGEDAPLPGFGPGGGRGRPGDGEVPLPPGMQRPAPPLRERLGLDVTRHDPARKERP